MTREEARHYLQSSGFSAEQIATIEQAFKQEPKTVKSCDTCKHDEAFGCPSFIHDRCENYSEWEQADKSKCKAFKQEPSSDLIRRTDLLDMVEDMTDQFGIKHRVITEGMISLLPSVNSQSCEDAISRKALKHKLQEHHDFFVNAYGGFSNLPQNDKSRVDEILNCIAMVVNEPSVKPQDCDTCEVGNPCLYCKHEFKAQADGEYISRQDAISEIREMAKWHTGDAFNADRVIQHLKQLPTVAIPNKVGHWEYNQYDGYPNIGNWHCSECRNIVSDMPTCMGKPLYEFCPNCGCPMEIER